MRAGDTSLAAIAVLGIIQWPLAREVSVFKLDYFSLAVQVPYPLHRVLTLYPSMRRNIHRQAALPKKVNGGSCQCLLLPRRPGRSSPSMWESPQMGCAKSCLIHSRLFNCKRGCKISLFPGTLPAGKTDRRRMAATGPGEGKKAAAGSSLHSKTLLKSEQLYQYILESTVFPRETDCLRELRVATTTHPMSGMAASPDQVQLFGLLIEMLGARNAIEVGVFTGYSLLATALALPDDGKVVAIDVSRESYDKIGSPVVEKAGMAHKIDFRVGLALPVLDQLVAEDDSSGKFDFAFVDADKANFHLYHERLLRLVRVGGLIAYDNTLWGGSVAAPDDEALSERDRELAQIAREFNALLTGDRRVQVCQLAISDGIMLCRRVA